MSDIGGKYHYIMSCKYFNIARKKLIKRYYIDQTNTLKFEQLMNTENEKKN